MNARNTRSPVQEQNVNNSFAGYEEPSTLNNTTHGVIAPTSISVLENSKVEAAGGYFSASGVKGSAGSVFQQPPQLSGMQQIAGSGYRGGSSTQYGAFKYSPRAISVMETYLPAKGAPYGEPSAIAANMLYVKQKKGASETSTRARPPRATKRLAL